MQARHVNDNATTPPVSPAPAGPLPLVIPSETLFALGRREVVILHDGQAYRLRLTRQNKLILTK
jgi:hemin uptake protein HemP